MKALLTNYHQSPRKVRLVADLIRGKSIAEAHRALMYLPMKSSPALGKLIDSAVANARQAGQDVDALFIQKITVDKGLVMRRGRPFGRGRSGTIRKTMSIVKLELGTSAAAVKKVAKKAVKAVKTEKTEEAAPKAKKTTRTKK